MSGEHMGQDEGDSVRGYPTRAAAEQAALDHPAREHRPLYVCKDNKGTWHITSHPEYYKDAYQVMASMQSEKQGQDP